MGNKFFKGATWEIGMVFESRANILNLVLPLVGKGCAAGGARLLCGQKHLAAPELRDARCLEVYSRDLQKNRKQSLYTFSGEAGSGDQTAYWLKWAYFEVSLLKCSALNLNPQFR